MLSSLKSVASGEEVRLTRSSPHETHELGLEHSREADRTPIVSIPLVSRVYEGFDLV